ncbi:EAL domain-containing protein [Aurantiacibacter rhizosphaerae]|uniref:EAL domain-containing protein n=1 Tax=Aurantiacibacter rhizosphaerae TaxID=2691582 RepID=A0A844XEC7_9SPHN|nr:EAL domain-containing protein [Aurantiacibacter rhizosphaerae]MWV27835.1 EAL domain-containing protein [Aurantiacibacter rhizosphaerae]
MPVPVPTHDRRRRADRRRAEPHPISEELSAALAGDAVQILFQPQYRSTDSSLAGAEALVRWKHPELGELAGDAIVSIAQSGGITRRLARHIARAAFSAAAHWPAGLHLSLNVTAMDLFDRTFGEDLLEMLADSGFPPERLTLEITEQALVADLDRSARKLSWLAESGIQIALDDFGAGFCNFRYLKVLPLHSLKLDRSMIDGITTCERDLAVLRGIVAMAKALNIAVTAEGIETEDQRAVIVQEGCEVWQGYLGEKPMPIDGFQELACA